MATATVKQLDYYLDLCRKTGIEPADDYDEMQSGVMSQMIAELIDILLELEKGGTSADALDDGAEIDDDHFTDEQLN